MSLLRLFPEVLLDLIHCFATFPPDTTASIFLVLDNVQSDCSILEAPSSQLLEPYVLEIPQYRLGNLGTGGKVLGPYMTRLAIYLDCISYASCKQHQNFIDECKSII